MAPALGLARAKSRWARGGAGASPAASGEKAGGHEVGKSYVHTSQSLRSSPIRHEVDLSSSRGEGRRRQGGERAVQGGDEREAGASLVSSGGRASPSPALLTAS